MHVTHEYSNAGAEEIQTSYECACVLRDTIRPFLLRSAHTTHFEFSTIPSPLFMTHFSFPTIPSPLYKPTRVPFRRAKADVQEQIKLPGRTEQVLFCNLTPDQRRMYQAFLQSQAWHACPVPSFNSPENG